jgi:hypothetical protein
VDAVLARHRHQRGVLVDVEVAPLGGRQAAPVGHQEGHLAAALSGLRKAQPAGDRRDAAVRAEDPARLDPLAGVEDHAAHGIVRRARAQQRRDLPPEPHLGAGGRRDVHHRGVERDPPDAGAAVVPTDRREGARDLVTEHAPAVPDRRQPVVGLEPPHDAEPVQAVQGVREHHVGRDGVAREPVTVDQEHPSAGPGQHRGQRRPGTPGSHHHRVVLLRHRDPSLVVVLSSPSPNVVEILWNRRCGRPVHGRSSGRRHRGAAPTWS